MAYLPVYLSHYERTSRRIWNNTVTKVKQKVMFLIEIVQQRNLNCTSLLKNDTHSFNPKWYFQSSLSVDNQQITQKLFENFIFDDENFYQPKLWSCNVQSSWDES